MRWFDEGYWAINDQRDTAQQFLAEAPPLDGTRLLTGEGQRTISFNEFLYTDFDIIIASIPQHIEPFRKLAELKGAKLIIQIGNEWAEQFLVGHNVLASVKPRSYTQGTNAIFYHQEFDTQVFSPTPVPQSKKIYSFINCLPKQMPSAWSDYNHLSTELRKKWGFEFKSFGGQCPDGNMDGPQELADKMREAMMIFHVKEGGDGFGHIIYNAYSVGRPIITRSRFYKDRLAEELLVPGTFLDLDTMSLAEAIQRISKLQFMPEALQEMGEKAHKRFAEVVNYKNESERIAQWLTKLK
jgi:hypothetical protein